MPVARPFHALDTHGDLLAANSHHFSFAPTTAGSVSVVLTSTPLFVRLHQTEIRQQKSPFHFRSPAPPSSIVEKGNDRSIFFLLRLAAILEREEPNRRGQRPKASFTWIVAWRRPILTLPNLQPSLLILGLNIAVEIRGHHSYQGAGPSWLPEHSHYQTIFSSHLAIVERVVGVSLLSGCWAFLVP